MVVNQIIPIRKNRMENMIYSGYIRLIILIIAWFTSFQLYGQKKYDMWVSLMDGKSYEKGYLLNTKTNKITYIPKSYFERWLEENKDNEVHIPVSSIKYLSFREEGKTTKGLLWGGLIGGIGGGLLMQLSDGGFNYGKPSFSFGEKFLAGAVLGVPIGMLLGVVSGSKKQKVFISGNHKTYQEQRIKHLERYIFY